MKKARFSGLISLAIAIIFVGSMMITPAYAFEDENRNEMQLRRNILTGQKTNPSDVFALAADYMDANIQESGITAGIDETGHLQIMQIVNSPLVAKDGGTISQEIACSTFLLIDQEGQELQARSIYKDALGPQISGGLDEYQIFATLITYFDIEYSGSLVSALSIHMSRMTTTIAYGTGAYKASSLVHKYLARENWSTPDIEYTASTVYNPTARAYTYYPPDNTWYSTAGNPGGIVQGTATITAYGKAFRLESGLPLTDVDNNITL